VSGKGYRGTLFFTQEVGWDEVTGAWAATPSDVARAEAAFPAAVRAAMPGFQRPLKEYYRQYAGVVMEGKRKLVLLLLHQNALVDLEGDEKKRVVLVSDGGDTYINAIFDVASGRFDWVATHGEA
jgi:hypothetical protein